MEAVIKQGKSQYKVKQGDVILVDKLDLETGQAIDIQKVLLVFGDDRVELGRPLVPNAVVRASVLGHTKGDKVINFKYKPKKGYHRKVGHRQQFTEIRIDKIEI